MQSKVSICTLSETWLTEAMPSCLFDIPGYNLFRQDRGTANFATGRCKRGGGIIVYVDDSYAVSTAELEHLNVNTPLNESLWLTIKPPNIKKLTVATYYRPPASNFTDFHTSLSIQLDALTLPPKAELVILGDFNVNLLDNNSTSAKQLKLLMKQHALHQIIKTPTRYGSNNATLLDHIYTNSAIIPSDHCTVKTKLEFEGRSYKHYNSSEFQECIRNNQWDSLFTHQRPDEAWAEMLEFITFKLNEICPVRKFKVKQKKADWLTNDIIVALRDKDRILKQAKRSGNAEDLRQAKIARNLAKNLVARVKQIHFREHLARFSGEPKKFWRTLKELLPGKALVTSS